MILINTWKTVVPGPMSSRGSKLLSGGVFGVGEEVAVDDVGESSFEGAHGFHSRVAEFHPTLEELLRGG